MPVAWLAGWTSCLAVIVAVQTLGVRSPFVRRWTTERPLDLPAMFAMGCFLMAAAMVVEMSTEMDAGPRDPSPVTGLGLAAILRAPLIPILAPLFWPRMWLYDVGASRLAGLLTRWGSRRG